MLHRPGQDVFDPLSRAVREQRAGLGRTARRILGCPDAAQDAVQEALITLWLHPPDRGHEQAWLRRTVVHRSLHERRTQKRRKHWERAAVESSVADCPLCLHGREPEEPDMGALLDEALRALPEPFRSPYVLREVEGWDYTRIASALTIPLGTVRSRLHRARAILREHLKEALVRGARQAPSAVGRRPDLDDVWPGR